MNSSAPSANSPWVQKGNIYAIPIIHGNMEMAAQVRLAFTALKPDCVAVELPEMMAEQLQTAAGRLPEISAVAVHSASAPPLYYICEPCDAAFEALRSALESNIPSYCIDLDVDGYPNLHEQIPDPYAIQRVGLGGYYALYRQTEQLSAIKTPLDLQREMQMAKRLKALSFSYERILFVCGMAHLSAVIAHIDRSHFPELQPAKREKVTLCAPTEKSCREIMAEWGWLTAYYEEHRLLPIASDIEDTSGAAQFPPDRQKLIYSLFREAGLKYVANSGNSFPGYHLRNVMKFVRNYAYVEGRLLPDLFQILSAAKGCVDHNYAYEVWELSTAYPWQRNVDNLPEVELTAEEVWGNSRAIRFHLKEQSRKKPQFELRPDKSAFRFAPPNRFTLCSYPPEDIAIENFGAFLKKKASRILTEEAGRVMPFSTSLEDGIDSKETIRHWHEKKLYVRIKGRPPGQIGSLVVIFDLDQPEETEKSFIEKYPWQMTWQGEHNQESDMAFYATPMTANVVGPGICRCEYGGFMLSYPPRRLIDVWRDLDYRGCRSKAELLLVAAIDYAIDPIIVYVAAKPPRSAVKSFAKRYGKKVAFVPIGQLSPVTLNKIRIFHVLDGRNKRDIANKYIF
jgi:hypothetical protein